MNHYIKTFAWTAALAAALLAGIYAAWREVPVWVVTLRCGVIATLVYGFVRLGGEVAGNSLLRGLAEHQIKKEELLKHPTSAEKPAAGGRKAA